MFRKYRLSLFAMIVLLVLPFLTLGATPFDGGEAYVYPIVPGTDAWKELKTHEEMIAVTQIPPDVLEHMSTRALVTTVLDYPLYGDVFAYNSRQQGFDRIAESFNGLQELLRRKDAAREVVAVYVDMDPLATESGWTLEQEGEFSHQFTYVELLLAQDELLGQLSPERRLELLELTWDKVRAKQRRSDVFGVWSLGTSALLSGKILMLDQPGLFHLESRRVRAFLKDGARPDIAALNAVFLETAEALGEEPLLLGLEKSSPKDFLSYVYTPNGSAVIVTWVTDELTSSEIAANDAYVRSLYPEATLLRSSTKKYNCHSYAWHSQSFNNHYG